jgi:cold shock CspA family protein
MPRLTGRVKWFNNAKGYGFIECESSDIFCHYSAIQGDGFKILNEGDEVEFEITQGPKGPQAEKIIRLTENKPEEETPADDRPEGELEEQRFIAIANIDGKNRLVALTPDGRYQFLDEASNLHRIVYVVTSETLALQTAAEELESLMNDPNAKEKDFQDFFERHRDFILNDEYKDARSHVVLSSDEGKRLIPDFVLEPIDQSSLCDLLELKLPSVKIFILKENRMHYSAAVAEACAQLRMYSEFFDEEKNRITFEKTYPGLRAYKPKMFVIIGRQGKVDPLIRRSIESDMPNLILRTYDEVLNRAKWKVDAMKKGKLRTFFRPE